jgi:ABC-type antimicrobial peptide transport system permease subunit
VTLLTRSDQLIDAFVSDHYDDIQVQFESEQTITYQEYIKSSVTNIYHPDRDYEYFFNQAFTDELEELLHSTNDVATLSFSKNQSAYDLEIVGVFKSEEPIDFDTVIVSGSQYESLINSEQIYPYHSMITLLGSEFSSNQALIHDLMNLTGQVYLIGRNDILSNVSFLGSLFEGISNVLTFVTIGIGVLTLLILFTFIYSSIQHHQKDIGILRSMGAGFKHIYAWFTAESLILLGLSALLSASLLGITSFAMNQMVKAQATINVSLLVTSPRQYLLIMIIALVIACISTLIPVAYYVKKNPIDSIRRS